MVEHSDPLKDKFEDAQQMARLVVPCVAHGLIAIGKIIKVEDVYTPPEDTPEYGIGLMALEKHDVNSQDRIKLNYVNEEVESLEQAASLVLKLYDKNIWDEKQALTAFVEKHSGRVTEKIGAFYVEGIDDAKANEIAKDWANDASSLLTNRMALIDNINQVKSRIETTGEDAENAVAKLFAEQLVKFGSMGGAPETQKFLHDLKQMRLQIMNALTGKPLVTMQHVPDDSIVLTGDVPDVGNVNMLKDRTTGESRVSALAFMTGSFQSHAMMKAEGYGMTVAQPKDASILDHVQDGEMVVIAEGKMFVSPTEKTLNEFREKQKQELKMSKMLIRKSKAHKNVETLDGQKVKFLANHDDVSTKMMKEANPDGFGLVRTEFLVRDNEKAENITEDQWFERLEQVMTKYAPKGQDVMPATFRFLEKKEDKADKDANGNIIHRTQEELEDYEAPIRERQMRALLRLQDKYGEGKVRVMSPMIRSAQHLQDHQAVMDGHAKDMGLNTIQLGSMGEVPSFFSDIRRTNAKFVSIGSNDLNAALMNRDRYAGEVDPTNHAFYDYTTRVIEDSKKRAEPLPIGICGDAASKPELMAYNIGMGLNTFSAKIPRIPLLKELASRVDTEEAVSFAKAVNELSDETERMNLIRQYNEARLGYDSLGYLDPDWETSEEPWFSPLPDYQDRPAAG